MAADAARGARQPACPSRRRFNRSAALVSALLLVSGCSAGTRTAPPTVEPSQPATPSPSSGSSADSPALATRTEQRCGTAVPGGVRVTESKVPSSDGVTVRAVTLGSGPRGVVLVHQTDAAALCGWLPFGGYLATRGFHVALLDLRCHGESSCADGYAAYDVISDVEAVVSRLRRAGARTVDVVGASTAGRSPSEPA